jgi:AcrR family transcriptional regulator
MEPGLTEILERVRELFYKVGVRKTSLDTLCHDLCISRKLLFQHVGSKHDLVEKLLELERRNFEIIFETNNFDGVNSIDVLLTVSKEISDRFWDISPSMTFDLKKYYPEIYTRHIERRVDFIFNQIQLNLKKGIRDGMYRNDLSTELIARLYIRRLIDLHDPEYFPGQFSFQSLFEVMFDNFIRGISTDSGIRYYEQQKGKVHFKNLPG